MGPLHIALERVMERMHELRYRYDSKVSLIGWSLGGIYARELAWMAPDDVRQVITLGTPFRHHHSTAATALYHSINGHYSPIRLRICRSGAVELPLARNPGSTSTG